MRSHKLAAAAVFAASLPASSISLAGSDASNFWKELRTGTNTFNQIQTEQWFKDANAAGISWTRLTFGKWKSAKRDFLIGNADDYQGLVTQDLKRLKQALDWAAKHNVRVVLTPLDLPGARYRQNNGNKNDGRLWQDKKYWEQAKQFWVDLASEVKDHPAIVGYNILNEPAPEFGRSVEEHVAPGDVARFADWQESVQGTPADLYGFYEGMIEAIRTVDADTPIMVDAGWYAQPGAFTGWQAPLSDDNVLYSFHMYEPYAFTSGSNFRKKKGLTYPGKVPFGDSTFDWNKATLETYLDPFFNWADDMGIPRSKLVAGEFGCMRRNEGCQQYLADLIGIFDEKKINWAFYSFREDEWDGYDYEVGSKPLPWKYWQAKERGEKVEVPRSNTKLFTVIKQGLK